MSRVLLLTKTTGYQTRAFTASAERLGVDLVYATDRCAVLTDPWQDGALPIRFDEEAASVGTILQMAATTSIDGVLAVGDRPTVIAARVARELGLAWHAPEGAMAAGNKLLMRRRMRDAGLLTPRCAEVAASGEFRTLGASVPYPRVIKPLGLSGSRGVMRVNDPSEFVAALYRLRALLQAPDIQSDRGAVRDVLLVEEFVRGREFAVEGLMTGGALEVLAVFDKPDPLEGPFFEETIYVTPPATSREDDNAIVEGVTAAAVAIGLHHGPIHAECRLNERGVFVLEIAARPIGGLCSRALRFERKDTGPAAPLYTLEDLLLRHALGDPAGFWRRERRASGVMMIPIPRRGVFRGVHGLDEATRVAAIEDVWITAKTDQVLVPLPEGASYLGFIFARADRADQVERALRCAHSCLRFAIDPEVRVVQSAHG